VADASRDDLERFSVARALRQELESLRRAGLDRIPASPQRDAAGTAPQLAEESERPAAEESPRPESPIVAESRRLAPSSSEQGGAPPHAASGACVSEPTALSVTPTVSASSAQPRSHLGEPAVPSLFGAQEFETPPIPACDRSAMLSSLASDVSVCSKCPHLAVTRTQTVFGVGSPTCRLMFVGEAPGADEDRLGEPFVGRAGQLLTDMITKGMGLRREDVYIANILKCRPPENRSPSVEEQDNCFSYLEQQIAILRPEFLCMLGLVAAQRVLETTLSLSRLRGRWHRYRGIPTLVTYHPAFLLRTPSFKKQAWEDLQVLMKELGLKIPTRSH
jgi:DNA polymerase